MKILDTPFFLYLGHVGALQGKPLGPDSTDFWVHDMGGSSGAGQATMQNRPFGSFQETGWLGFHYNDYAGGYTPYWPVGPLDARNRKDIVVKADSLVGSTLTWNRSFTKSWPTREFRCDSLIEYVYEEAGITGGPGGWKGLWPEWLEPKIPNPRSYVAKDVRTSLQTGSGPDIDTFTVTQQGAGGFLVTGTAADRVLGNVTWGSGIRGAWAGYYTSTGAFVTLGSDTTEADYTRNFSLSFTTGGVPSATAALRVFDRAGNESSQSFIIKTTPPNAPDIRDADGNLLPSTIKSTTCVVIAGTDSLPVISSMSITDGASYWRGWSADSAVQYSTKATLGGKPICNLPPATYTVTVCDFAGNCSSRQLAVEFGTYQIAIPIVNGQGTGAFQGTNYDAIQNSASMGLWACIDAGGSCSACNASSNPLYPKVKWSAPTSAQSEMCPCDWPVDCRCCNNANAPARSVDFTIVNTTFTDAGTIDIFVSLDPPGAYRVSVTTQTTGPAAQGSISGRIEVSQIGISTPVQSPGGTVRAEPQYTGLTLASAACASGDSFLGRLRQVLRLSSGCYEMTGSFAAFASTIPLTFQYADASADTTTLRIYYFDGTDWSSAPITQQGVVKDTTTLVITATGAITHSGLYAAMFAGVDTVAPETAFSVAGTSHTFDGRIFASTDSYYVLTATDPAVSGYASQVSSIYFRVDGGISDAFEAYVSSLALPIGVHRIEYYAQDYAGNSETIRVATVAVTYGDGARVKNDLTVGGRLRAGSLDTGAGLDILAGAVSDYVLKVSSTDGASILAVDFLGNMGVGKEGAQARLDIASGEDASLQLRSGNSTGTPTSAQIAFGYDGTAEMRHAIRTEHHASTAGNRMSFLLWTPAQSAASLGAMELLSLRASSAGVNGQVHVRPVVDGSTQALIVSNGATPGGGTVHRLSRAAPSSRELKTDIAYLGAEEEDLALAEVLALKPVRFRYKRLEAGEWVRDPSAPLHRGLLYEEAPASIRGGGSSIATDERIANLELALKAELRLLRELRGRIRSLKVREK